jgi:hypothetical protein
MEFFLKKAPYLVLKRINWILSDIGTGTLRQFFGLFVQSNELQGYSLVSWKLSPGVRLQSSEQGFAINEQCLGLGFILIPDWMLFPCLFPGSVND